MQDTLARKLRVLRAERGLTLREAEQQTGVDKDTLSKLERGVRHPQDVTLARIAKGYGVPVEELLKEPEEFPPKESRRPDQPPLAVYTPPAPRDDLQIGRVERYPARIIEDAIPEAPVLLEKNVGHAYLNVPVDQLVDDARQGGSVRIAELIQALDEEDRWLRRYYFRTTRKERKTPQGKRVDRERRHYLSDCLRLRLKALKPLRDEEMRQLDAKLRQLDAELEGIRQ